MPSGAYFFGGITLKNPFNDLSKFELSLWIISVVAVSATFFLFGQTDCLTLASYLTACRSAYYALAYAANDVVLIVLWVIAAGNDAGCVPMIACFSAFLVNDIYGFINWQSIRKRQRSL